MRLLDLGLDRYGPFTDRRLIFRPDAKLHIVHGANEAGKSCSLAAVTDLLFGIERQTAYDFLHPGKEMRLTARVRDNRGAILAFKRSKNKPQIAELSGVALPDDALAPYLGGVTRTVFQRAFGLNAEALRRSSEELKQSDGELGAALFSAASGLRGFADVQKALQDEADGIYADRRANSRLFYQALDRFEKARKDLREHETRGGDLKKLRDELAEQGAEVERLRARRAEIATEFSRLERLRRAQPIVRAIDDAQAALAALGEAPNLPAGIGEALVAAVETVRRAQEDEQKQSAASTRLEEELAGITFDAKLIDASGEIEKTRIKSGEYAKALLDLPVVEREHAAVLDMLSRLARRLGLADVAALMDRQPDDASRVRVAALLEQGTTLKAARDGCAAASRREASALETRQASRQASGILRDPKPFVERLNALAGVIKRAEAMLAEAPELEAEKSRLSETAARLSPPVRDLDRLAAASFPNPALIKTYAARFEESERSLTRSRDDLAKAKAELAQLSRALADLSASGPVPTPDAIAAARAERDNLWSRLSSILLGAATPADATATPAHVAAFERAKAEADRLADARATDATRVAAHLDKTRQATETTIRIEACETHGANLESASQRLREEWTAHWGDADVKPLAPADMLSWRVEIDGLLARRDRWRDRQSQHAAGQRGIDDARPEFDALIRDLGLEAMAGLPAPALADRISAEIENVSRHWSAARDDEAIIRDLGKRAEAAAEAEAKAQESFSLWQKTFQTALPRIGLTEAADESEAAAVLDAWRDVPAAETQLNLLRRRIDGIRRDARQFEADIKKLVDELAPDLAGQAADAILQTLSERTTTARDARTRREETHRRVEEAAARLTEARSADALARRALTSLVERTGLPADTDFEAMGRRLASRDAIVRTLDQKRDELANAADGRAETDLRQALATHDADSAEHAAASLREEDRTLERAVNEAYAAHRDIELKLRGLESAVGAEIAAQQRRNAETEMVEAARDWAVLSIGARMIGAAIERQRVGRQEPLMMRAGELFELLTGGSYRGLGQEYEDDTPHLVGHRSSGGSVKIANMSEGTRDQLYLALRLAYVEDFARTAEPPPFLGDDLFASFDDARTAHGLRALAAIGGTVQPILFTHHGFVVETARRELGDDVDILTLATDTHA